MAARVTGGPRSRRARQARVSEVRCRASTACTTPRAASPACARRAPPLAGCRHAIKPVLWTAGLPLIHCAAPFLAFLCSAPVVSNATCASAGNGMIAELPAGLHIPTRYGSPARWEKSEGGGGGGGSGLS